MNKKCCHLRLSSTALTEQLATAQAPKHTGQVRQGKRAYLIQPPPRHLGPRRCRLLLPPPLQVVLPLVPVLRGTTGQAIRQEEAAGMLRASAKQAPACLRLASWLRLAAPGTCSSEPQSKALHSSQVCHSPAGSQSLEAALLSASLVALKAVRQ
jgi:hypothetical protein